MSRIEACLIDEAAFHARRTENEKSQEAMMHYQLYNPRGERGYECPKCWIKFGRRGTLRSVPSAGDHDLMRCNVCDTEIVID